MAALVAGFGAWAQGLPEVRLLFGQVCIINLFASMACVSAFRDLNTRTRVEWWRSLMVCGIWWYGGGSTVGVIVSKVPGWVHSNAAFAGFLLSWWLILHTPGDFFYRAYNNFYIRNAIRVIDSVNSAHNVHSGVFALLAAKSGAALEDHILMAIVCSVLMDTAGGLIVHTLNLVDLAPVLADYAYGIHRAIFNSCLYVLVIRDPFHLFTAYFTDVPMTVSLTLFTVINFVGDFVYSVAKFDLFSPLIGSVVLRALGVPVTFRRSSASALKGHGGDTVGSALLRNMSGIPSRNCDGTQEILDGIRESSSFGPGSEAEVKPRQTLWETPKNRGCMASVSFMDFAASLGGTLDFRNLNTNHKPWFHSYIVCFVIWFGGTSAVTVMVNEPMSWVFSADQVIGFTIAWWFLLLSPFDIGFKMYCSPVGKAVFTLFECINTCECITLYGADLLCASSPPGHIPPLNAILAGVIGAVGGGVMCFTLRLLPADAAAWAYLTWSLHRALILSIMYVAIVWGPYPIIDHADEANVAWVRTGMIAACYASELVNVYLEVDVWGPVVFAPLKLLDSLKALRSGRRKAERSFSGLL